MTGLGATVVDAEATPLELIGEADLQLRELENQIMRRAIRVVLGLLVSMVGLMLFGALAVSSLQQRVNSFFDATRRWVPSASHVQLYLREAR